MSKTLSPEHQALFVSADEWLKYHLLNHAEISFRRILNATPDHYASRHLWGVTLVRLGRHEEGLAAIRQALRGEPENRTMYRDLAAALQLDGQHEMAQAAWDRTGPNAGPIPDPLVFSYEQGEFKFTSVDYDYRSIVRYGEGKPPHPELTAMLEKQRPAFSAFLDEIAEITADFADVPMYGTYDNPLPIWLNGWFPPLDGMVLTQFLRRGNPKRFVEIGSGVSTKFTRRAVDRYGLQTHMTSIDPQPRNEIDSMVDQVIRSPLEDCDLSIFEALEPGDILFLDSSHRSFQGSDVTVFFMEILPRVKPGVIVHIHDIYLPDDYITGHLHRQWNEQYLLATALLFGGDGFEVLFPCWFAHRDPALSAQANARLRTPETSKMNLYGASFWLTRR